MGPVVENPEACEHFVMGMGAGVGVAGEPDVDDSRVEVSAVGEPVVDVWLDVEDCSIVGPGLLARSQALSIVMSIMTSMKGRSNERRRAGCDLCRMVGSFLSQPT
jgi:hypothetical protein